MDRTPQCYRSLDNSLRSSVNIPLLIVEMRAIIIFYRLNDPLIVNVVDFPVNSIRMEQLRPGVLVRSMKRNVNVYLALCSFIFSFSYLSTIFVVVIARFTY